MTKEKLNQLETLLQELEEERIQKYRDDDYDVDSMEWDELVELDDGDCLLSGIDIVAGVVETMLDEVK